ncbi:DUF3157 family protein [Ferrimonas senticii]|uniref:DUF3157 family protein n=1 Tax=Ferrimonas senticii TaxID=394566 RepID=UPI00041E181E|nr:DUF3157 family protein [Ferrimonas senticii]
MKLIKAACLLLPLTWHAGAYAAEQITLDDGRVVQLNDDFTWQYLPASAIQPAQKPTTTDSTVATDTIPAMATTPAASTQVGVAFRLGQTQTIGRVAQYGLQVELGAPQWQDGELLIPTTVLNTGLKSIIEVELQLQIYSAEGKLLAQEQLTAFHAITRLADTYLRPQQQKEGNELRLALPKQSDYRIEVAISDIDYRG